ncbi:MAG: PhoU domain-containing protein [Planctomycetota bacterium]
MLRELIEAWKGQDLQSRMLDEFDEMLAAAQWIFEQASAALLGEEGAEGVRDEIALRDRKIKELEARIRKQIIEHLTIRPGKDVTGCLIMMSVVKDAERIGD